MSPPPDKPPRPFKVLGHLGRGASADVFLVEMLATGEQRVLKRIALVTKQRWPRERAEKELAVLARLDHPNVVRLLEVDVQDHFLEVHYPYLPGASMDAYMKARGRLPVPTMLAILSDVLAGLVYLHGQGLVHRDLKPENIYLTKAGRSILLDLGLVKDLGSSDELTATGEFVGTPRYCAPETFTTGEVSPGTDIYALGILTFISLTGEPPFGKMESLHEAIEKHLSVPMPTLASAGVQAPRALEDLVAQMAAKQPEDRPSAEAVRKVVERLRAEPAAVAASPTPEVTEARPAPAPSTEKLSTAPILPPSGATPAPAPPSPPPRRRPGVAALAVLGLAMIAGGALRLGTDAPPPTPAAPPSEAPPPEVPTDFAEVDAVRALVDSWQAQGLPDPARDFAELVDHPALTALRQRWATLPEAARPALAAQLQELDAEARAVGFPGLLTPYLWPVPEAGDASVPARCHRALAHVGGTPPRDLALPGAGAAVRAIEHALELSEVLEARLEKEPEAIVGTSGSLQLFKAVMRAETRGGVWYVLSTGADKEARRGLYAAYEPVMVATVHALRHLALVLARAPGDEGRIAAETWMRHEIQNLRAPIFLVLYVVPTDDLLVGLPPGRREVIASTLLTMASRIHQAAVRPYEALAERAIALAGEARRRPPTSGPLADADRALGFTTELRALQRFGMQGRDVALLEEESARWGSLDPAALQDILADAVVTMRERLDMIPAGLKARMLEGLTVDVPPLDPTKQQVAVEYLRGER